MLINSMQEETLEKQRKSNMMVTITVKVRALFYVKRDVREEERVRKLGHSPHMLFNTWHHSLTKVHNSYGKRGEEKTEGNIDERKTQTPAQSNIFFSLRNSTLTFWHLLSQLCFFLEAFIKKSLCINYYFVVFQHVGFNIHRTKSK